MSIHEGIVESCRATAGKGAKFFWDWAVTHGWKNPHGSGGGNGYLAWCAVAASYRVWEGTQGRITLAFGQPQRLSMSRFALGNASVFRIYDDAKRLGIVTQEPKPGMLCLTEIRRKDKPWPVRPGHIGIVTALKVEDGKVVGVRSREGNYGGRDVEPYRPMVAKAGARERIFCFVDLEEYARNIGVTPMDTVCDDGDDDCTVSDDTFDAGNDYEVVIGENVMRARVVGMDEQAQPMLQPVADDGEVVMDAPVFTAEQYLVLGPWDS